MLTWFFAILLSLLVVIALVVIYVIDRNNKKWDLETRDQMEKEFPGTDFYLPGDRPR